MKLFSLILAFLSMIVNTGAAGSVPSVSVSSYGFSVFGTLKYPAGFTHFDYVNPNAPRDGNLRLGVLGTFDSLNPYIVRGISPAMIGLTTATLLDDAGDCVGESYGYGAESVELAPDHSWVKFHLNPNAVFSNGDPVTSDDIIWVFETLRTQGLPLYRTYYKDIIRTEKIDDHTIQFFFKTTTNTELPLILGQLPLLSKKYFSAHPFERTTLIPPPCSGPYRIESLSSGHSVTYKRVANWWGALLPSQRGRHNFNHITVNYYRESNALFEGFKSGQYDLRVENTAENWVRNYTFPAVRRGLVKREELKHSLSSGTYGFFFNTRRPLFSDRRARKALSLLFNFPWINKHLYYGLYKRNKSYYPNSDFEAKGLPHNAEKNFLKPFANRLPAEIFTTEFTLPNPQTEEDARQLQTEAQTLFKEAGYEVKNSAMVYVKTGKPFAFTLFIQDRAIEKVAINFADSLRRLGIEMHVRNLDTSAYQVKVQNLDYDIILATIPQSQTPGNEQRDFFGSEKANVPGTVNYAGIQNTVADQLIEQIVHSKTYQSLIEGCRSLDRVLLWEYYMIPAWSSGLIFVASRKGFVHPERLPKYRGLDITTWWFDNSGVKNNGSHKSHENEHLKDHRLSKSKTDWWNTVKKWFKP